MSERYAGPERRATSAEMEARIKALCDLLEAELRKRVERIFTDTFNEHFRRLGGFEGLLDQYRSRLDQVQENSAVSSAVFMVLREALLKVLDILPKGESS